jgi:hypothetical protein
LLCTKQRLLEHFNTCPNIQFLVDKELRNWVEEPTPRVTTEMSASSDLHAVAYCSLHPADMLKQSKFDITQRGLADIPSAKNKGIGSHGRP